MRKAVSRLRWVVAGVATLALLAGCTSAASSDDTKSSGASSSSSAGSSEGSSSSTAEPSSSSEAPASTARTGRVIQLTGPEPTQGFDPAVALTDASRIRMGYMYAKLLEMNKEGEIEGALAEKWDISDDGTVYTFTLRDTANFSDGTPVTAADVIFSLEYMQASETMKGSLPEIKSITADGDKTVVITLAKPAGRQLELALLREGNAGIISKAAVEAAGGPEAYFVKPTATSGPFVMAEYSPASHIEFSANEHFWREGYPKSKGVYITFQTDVPAQLAALETGAADIAPVAYENFESMKAAGQYDLYTVESLAPTFWGLRKSEPPFDNKLVRQAFAYAVDREGPRSACWFGTGGVSYGNILLEASPYYVENKPYQLSRSDALAKAGSLLDEAGWIADSSGKRVAKGVAGVTDGTPLEVTVPFEANWPAAECNTVILQQTFAEIGVKITPEAYDPASHYSDAAAGKMAMWHGGAGSPTDEAFFADWFASTGLLTPLTTQLNDPEIDKLVEEGLTTPDRDRAVEIFKGLDAWQIENVPMLVIGYQWMTEATTKALTDYWVGPDAGSRPLTEAWIKE